ncbi:Equilibrative nucleotide transporter 5 isoform B [Glycine soja]|uniref:Equilibrative nucleotide transporter 5 isoform B n=1 Tax=Glycine soja TaxID=3848 RepID=A0A445I4I4_GLYSO|nr:Equilibrative nucleotide transporter 5 isoform B [Glycine soja]
MEPIGKKVKRVYFGTGGDHCKYPVVLIAMYNVVDFIPIYIPLVPWLKLESRKGLLIAVFSRFLLIPAFYFTAKYGDQGWMILLASFLGLTNGYLTVCVLTVAPRGKKTSYPIARRLFAMRRYGGGILYAALPLHMQRGCFRIRTHDQQVTKAQLYRCTRLWKCKANRLMLWWNCQRYAFFYEYFLLRSLSDLQQQR